MIKKIKNYFFSPSTEGFSAYRTGQNIHLLFSVIVSTSICLIVNSFITLNISTVCILSFLIVLLFWGVGVIVGVHSHYNLLITIIIFIAFLMLIAFGLKKPEGIISFIISTASHFVIYTILKIINKLIV